MANIDKDIVITPNKDQTADPSIAFSGANAAIGAQTIYANVYPLSGGTLSFEGSAGQLFSITNTLSGTIFSVNDISGIPSIEVLDTGVVRLAQYNGNVGIGTSTAQAGYKLQVTGNAAVTGRVGIGTSNIFGVSNSLVVYGTAMVYGNLDLANPAGGTSGIYFNDGTYQTTAAGTVQNSSGIAGTVQYSGGSGTFAGDATNFFWDSTNKRLGIGSSAPTNTLTVWGATPAWFNTTNGADVIEVVVGNTTATSTTIGYAAAASTPYGYITATASSVKNVTFNSLGFTGIGGITLPKNTLDVGGRMVIGALYAGSAIYTAPTNGLAVQGSVGVGTSGPASTLDVNGWAGFRQGLSAASTVTVASLTSNGAVSGTTGTFTGALYGASFNTAGTATVNALASNGAISGTTITGTAATVTSLQNSGTTTTNALVSNVYGLFGQNVTVNSTNASTSTTTGALILAGGAGIAGNINVGGTVNTFTGNVGIGTNSPTSALHVASPLFPVARIERISTATTGSRSSFASVNRTTGDMLDTFGSDISFIIRDNANVDNEIATFGAYRDGADNSGTLIFSTYNAGVFGVKMYIKPDGKVGIGTTTPGSLLDVNGIASIRSAMSVASTATVNALVSNGDITGTTINGTAGTFTSLQISGTTTTNALVSNVYGRFGQNVTVNSTNVSTSTTTGALIVAGGAGFAGNVNLGGYIQMPQMRMYSFTRTIPTVVNNVVELGSATLADGGGMFEISIVCPSSGFSVSKYYILPINFAETAGGWTIAQPISDGGAYSSNDFDLDINVNSNVASFRIRRTAGSTAGTAYVNIKQSGLTLTFAETTTTASVTAPTGFYNAAVLRQVDGRVGIGTASPLSTLDVNGISTLRSTTLVNTTTTGANGTLQVSGSIGLQGNSQIRQASNSDGTTLQLLATSVVVASTNSGSYGYAGGGLLSSTSDGDGTILLDAGRVTTTNARVKVVNTTSGNAYLSVEKNGVYTLYASTAGQVGIATSSPGSVLDVNGNASFRSAVSVAGATAVASLNVNAGTYTNSLNVNTTANVNALTSNTGITVSAGGITVTGLSTFTGNVNVTGNLTVTGTINTQNANVLVVNDPIIYLGEGNTSNLWDLGIIANYNDGVYEHTGLVRNRNDGIWTLFDNMTSEPNVSTGNINWADSTLTFAPMKLGNLTVVGNTRSTTSSTGAIVLSGLGGIGVGGNIYVGGQQSGISGNLWIGGTNVSTSSTTGALVVTNGVGIGGALNVGGQIYTAGVMNAGSTAIVNALTSNGAISGTTGAFSGALTLTSAAPQINLNNGTSNWIAWNTNGVAAPTFTTRSAGTKLVLYPNIGAANTDYALGIEGSTMWFTVDTTSAQYKWYGGTTQAMLLSGAGALSTTSTTTSTAFIPSGSTVPTNGMFLPAANTVGFASNSTAGMRLTSTGNLLIGTTTNYTKLTVSNGASTRTGVTLSDANTASLMLFAGASQNAVISTDSIYQELIFKRGSTVGTENGTETMRIDSIGQVGIGTSVPREYLHLNNPSAAGDTPRIKFTNTNTGGGVSDGGFIGISNQNQLDVWNNEASLVRIGTSGTERMRVDAVGNVSIGTNLVGAASGGRISLTVNGTNGSLLALATGDTLRGYVFTDTSNMSVACMGGTMTVQTGAAQPVIFATNSIERMRVTSTGSVGIGSTTPTTTLDVNGAITMYNEGQNLDARYFGGNFIRGWSEFAVGTAADLVYTSNVTAPVGTTVIQVATPVWVRGPKIPLDLTRNYEVELYICRTVAGVSTGVFYMAVQEWDANGNNIAGDGTDYSYPVSSLAQSTLTVGQWYNYRFVLGPYGGIKNHASNGRFISLGFIANYSGTGNDTLQFCGFRIRPLPRYPGDAITVYNSGWVGIGTTTPGSALDVNGNATLRTAVTTTAASHYYVQTGSDNVVRPKTLANVQSEIVTTAAVNAALSAYSVKTANYTAVNNDRLLCDTSGGTFTITLPAAPTLGTNITIYDKANFTAIPLTIARNGLTIEGLADDFSLDIGQTRNEIVYDGSTWHIYVSIGPRGLSGSNAAPSSSVAYSVALG